MERSTVKLQGYNIDSFNVDEALRYITEKKGIVITINPEMVKYGKQNPEFADFVNTSELVIPDGIGIEIGLRILGYKIKRIAGIDFAKRLVAEFSKTSQPIAFIGSKPQIAELAVQNLKKEYENLNACYIHDGYFQDDKAVLNELVNSNPKLVLIALGSPKQEFFIRNAKKLLPDTIFIGIGGSFDVWSGTVKRAPKIYQKLGLEWLYRTIKEPQRFKRIFPTLPLFLVDVITEKICGEK